MPLYQHSSKNFTWSRDSDVIQIIIATRERSEVSSISWTENEESTSRLFLLAENSIEADVRFINVHVDVRTSELHESSSSYNIDVILV